jgi:hypothetical protein
MGGNFIYQWFFERWAIPGATSNQHNATQSGTYHVLAVAPDGNGNYSEPFAYNSVGIYENGFLQSLTIHPNPGNGMVFINSKSSEIREYMIEVSDVSGRVVYRDAMNAASHQMDLTGFGKGVMTLRISDLRGNKRFEKLIVCWWGKNEKGPSSI